MSENTGDHSAIGAQPDEGPRTGRRRRSSSMDLAKIRSRTGEIVATVVRWFGSLVAILMVAQVVLTLGGANPDNGITRFVTAWAKPLALGFADLFAPADPQLAVLINYGIAALFWLFVTSIAVRIIRAVS